MGITARFPLIKRRPLSKQPGPLLRNLLRERIHNNGLDLGSFFMVGDKPDGTKDIHRVGGKDILLDKGKYTDSKVIPDFPAENHTSAVPWIIGCMEK